jgi:MFS family permease
MHGSSPRPPLSERLRGLPALIAAQISLHSGTTGLRVAGPLILLQSGAPTWQVGVLLACFGLGPLLLAWPIGRLVDARGYRPPMAIALALGIGSSLIAWAASVAGDARLTLLCVAAAAGGGATNAGLMTLQRTAARMASDAVALRSTFAWVGLAPSASNVLGPLAAGVLLDLVGPHAALFALLAFPLIGWSIARLARPPAPPPIDTKPATGTLTGLLRNRQIRRLLLVDFLVIVGWDVHAFVVPTLGHARGLSATAIGTIYGLFAAGVVTVRATIPWVSHRLSEYSVMAASLLATAVVFAIYPLGTSAMFMGACAVVLGMTIGIAQPMIMSAMHQAVPDAQRGGVLALRTISVNLQAVALPVGLAALTAALGYSAMLWGTAALIGSGGAIAQANRRR